MWASIGLLWHEPLLENYGLQPDLTADRVGLGSRISQHKTNKVGVGHAGWILPHICLEAIHLQSDSPHSLNNDIQVKTLWWTDRPDEGGKPANTVIETQFWSQLLYITRRCLTYTLRLAPPFWKAHPQSIIKEPFQLGFSTFFWLRFYISDILISPAIRDVKVLCELGWHMVLSSVFKSTEGRLLRVCIESPYKTYF